jgi:hypothetical protein
MHIAESLALAGNGDGPEESGGQRMYIFLGFGCQHFGISGKIEGKLKGTRDSVFLRGTWPFLL